MKHNDNIRTNNWSRLEFKDPEWWLSKLINIEKNILPLVSGAKARSLRTNKLKWVKESRQAALFTYGMSTKLDQKISFALAEDDDFDYIARYRDEQSEYYVPVQLKEWVPEGVNTTQSLSTILSGLKKYPDSTDLTVAIYVNRHTRLDLEEMRNLDLGFRQVWLFGSCSEDSTRWFIYGDIQEEPEYFEFGHPNR
jgi:hypothetical protein